VEEALASRLLPFRGVLPRLAAGAWVAPGATLIGAVELGPDASVWYGCILRGDVHQIRVGARSNVQDLSVVHVTRDRFATEIGDDVTVGHRAVVHGCRIGDGALVGIGAIVLDGAIVGEGAWIGAGAVVTPGSEIPPRMLALGTPARVVRPVGDEEYRDQLERTRAYVQTAREHALSQRTS